MTDKIHAYEKDKQEAKGDADQGATGSADQARELDKLKEENDALKERIVEMTSEIDRLE